MNNHIKMNRLNKTEMSREEVVALKKALVEALKRNGFTNEEKINEIRENLGLSKRDGESDIALDAGRSSRFRARRSATSSTRMPVKSTNAPRMSRAA